MQELQTKILEELTSNLNKVQKDAVTHVDGPLLIVAGAGSGKTRVIINRIAYLVRIMGVRPYNIAAVTFTNKAAQEMRHRLEKLIGPLARDVLVRTFHSLGLYIISRNIEELGLKSNFTIIDQNAQKTIIKRILKNEKMEASYLEPLAVANQINQARDKLLSYQEYEKSGATYAKEIAFIYKLYIQELRKTNSLDYSDLLYESVKLLSKNSEIQNRYSNLWKYFMIDEYQDTNHVQYLLGLKIAKSHQNIMVVGDDDQSIYSWRGADLNNILSFEKDYPKAKILKLEQNYRSVPVILKAAASLISKNKERRHKTLFSEIVSDIESIECINLEDEVEETKFVLNNIKNYKEQGVPLDQMAIFYRTNAQSRSFEKVLRENNVPYVIVGDIQFYERKEIKDILSYLNVIVNPSDDLSLERIINVPVRGIGETGIEKLKKLSYEKNISLFESLKYANEIQGYRSVDKAVKLYQNFITWQRLYEKNEKPSIIADNVIKESHYLHSLQNDTNPDAPGRIENIYEFIASLREYEKECEEQVASVYDLDLNLEEFGGGGDSGVASVGGDASNRSGSGGRDSIAGFSGSGVGDGDGRGSGGGGGGSSGNSGGIAFSVGNGSSGGNGDDYSGFSNVNSDSFNNHDNHEIIEPINELDNEDESIPDLKQKADLGDYLKKISLYTDKKTIDNLDSKCIFLMTLHNAKGLEFEIVFLSGLEDGFLPHRMSLNEGNIEEERRLLYVGITRAKKYLHLTHVNRRWVFGNHQYCLPSRFIKEIDKSVFINKNEKKDEILKNNFYTKTINNYKIKENKEIYNEGEDVKHEKYGEGKIIHCDKMPIGQKLTIKFPNESRPKIFLSQFTPLKKII